MQPRRQRTERRKSVTETAANVRVRLRRVPVRAGCTRSYVTAVPDGRIAVDRLRDGTWRVTDSATTAQETRSSLGACLGMARMLIVPPRGAEARFLTFGAVEDRATGTDCVLVDRVTGRWWLRRRDARLAADVAVMARIAESGVLPPEYGERQTVKFVPFG